MSFVTPAAGDTVRAQHVDLLRDALTVGALGVGNQWLGAPAAPTVATGAAGALTGAYKYGVTFVVVDPNNANAVLGETFVSPASATVNPSAQQVSLTAIPVSTNPRCNGRRVWRTTAGGGQLKLLTLIADNTTTALTDNAADGTLGANAPTTDTADGSVFSSQAFLFDLFFSPPT